MLLSAFFCFIPWQMCGRAEIKYNKCCKDHLLPTRRYAIAVTLCLCLCVTSWSSIETAA